MLLLKELPTSKSLQKVVKRYPEADIQAILDFATMLRAASDISVALDKLLAKHGLLQGRWWVLILLMREETFVSTPSVLADKAGVTRATMTGLIDGLERDGLVERIFDPQDRRRISVKLTQAGQDRLDAVMPDYYSRLRECMSGLSEEQRAGLHEMLELITGGIGAFTRS